MKSYYNWTNTVYMLFVCVIPLILQDFQRPKEGVNFGMTFLGYFYWIEKN